MPTLIMDSTPKFITCPDCGERYDNARKRRIIDTCGHPRCYSCLFVDNPCPLCEELPKERTKARSRAKDSSNESLDKVSPNITNLKKKSLGSHPDLVKLQKARSSTLPTSFLQDNYFRSLYHYNPHGSSESLASGSVSPVTGRPRSMPPSYHVSIENLNEQFWKSVELAEKKWSPRHKNKETQPKSTKEKATSSRPEVVECPAPDMVRLPVPATTRPKSQLDNQTRKKEEKKLVPVIVSELERPRSLSDVENFQRCTSTSNDSADGSTHVFPRPLSWSPTHFQINNRIPSRASSSISKSDRLSDSSTSINLSDTWSESSDSDSVLSPLDDRGAKNIQNEPRGMSCSSDDSNPNHSPPRKYKGNPLANVTYWVVDSRKSAGIHTVSAENDKATNYRPKPKVTHQWNGQTNHSVKASLVSVHTNVNTM